MSRRWSGFRKACSAMRKVQPKGGVARSLNNIGDAYRLQGRYDQALENLLKSLRLREEINDRRRDCPDAE